MKREKCEFVRYTASEGKSLKWTLKMYDCVEKRFEAVKPIEVKQHKPCKCYWYKITGDKEKDDALKSKLIDLMPDTLHCYQPTKSEYKVGRIVYNYHNSIRIENDIDRTFSQIVKMFGTELKVKEEQL